MVQQRAEGSVAQCSVYASALQCSVEGSVVNMIVEGCVLQSNALFI